MNEKFLSWCKTKNYEIKEDVLNEDGTVKEAGTNAQEMAGYFNEYNKEIQEELSSKLKEEITEANKEAIAKAVEELEDTLRKGQIEQLSELNKQLATQGLAIKRISEVNSGDVSITNATGLSKSLTDVEEKLTSMKENRSGSVQIKVAADMTIIGNVSGGNVPVEQRLPGLNRIQRVKTRIRNFVNAGIATSNVISWVEYQNPDGTPAGTVEGTLKNQIDFDLVVVSENVKKRTAFIKVSTEMLNDIDFMRSEIENDLFERLDLDVDDQILQGDNTGQNLNGILTQATAFAAGVFAGTVDAANLVDVLTVARNQVITANFMPTVHIVNPTDLTTLRLLKATDEQYVDRLIMVGDEMRLDGIPVVEHNGMPQDEFLTMDGSFDTVYSKGEISIQIGLDNDDFTKNLRTVLAEWRGLNLIKGNDLPAFVTGTISTAAAALETP